MFRHGRFVALTLVAIVVTSLPAFAQHTHEPSPSPAQHEHQPDGDAVSLFPHRDASGTAEAEFPPEPRNDVDRVTASATYHRPLSGGGIWATTLAVGVNAAREFIPVGQFDATTSRAAGGNDSERPRPADVVRKG